MKFRISLCLFMIVCYAGVAYAQSCDPLLPCGPLPWQLPSLPDLRSPTPLPTIAVAAAGSTSTPTQTPTRTPTALPTSTPMPTFTPFPTFTPYPTYTLIPTWTPFVDTSELNNSVGTLNAMVNATDIPINDLTGTPVGMSNIDDLAANTSTVFGYARGLADVNMGPITPLIVFMFTALGIFLFVRVLLIMLPVIAAIFGILRKVVQLILDFIPG